MRYGFEQLDRLNGYASGMPAPEFYQRMWEGKPVAGLIVELGREARAWKIGVSIADEIAALEHVRRLSALRGHHRPSREDLVDAHPLGLHQGVRRRGGLADPGPGAEAAGRRPGGKRAARGWRAAAGRGLPPDGRAAQGRARPDRGAGRCRSTSTGWTGPGSSAGSSTGCGSCRSRSPSGWPGPTTSPGSTSSG